VFKCRRVPGWRPPLICRNFCNASTSKGPYHSYRQGRSEPASMGSGRAFMCGDGHRRPKSSGITCRIGCWRHCFFFDQVNRRAEVKRAAGPLRAGQAPPIDKSRSMGSAGCEDGSRAAVEKSRRMFQASRARRADPIASRPIQRQHVANTETQRARGAFRDIGRFPFRSRSECGVGSCQSNLHRPVVVCAGAMPSFKHAPCRKEAA